MKKVKKSSIYISLLFITTLLSGCGTVEHYYFSSSRSHSKTIIYSDSRYSYDHETPPTSIPGGSIFAVPGPAVVFENGQELFKVRSEEVNLYLPEFGDNTNLIVTNGDTRSGTKIVGTVFGHNFSYDVRGVHSMYLYDVNRDNYRDLCIVIGTDSSNKVIIYDLKADERIYYIEPAKAINNDCYWLSLEYNTLYINRGTAIEEFDESDERGTFCYSEQTGVYTQWNNHQHISGLSLYIYDENKQILDSYSISTEETYRRSSMILNTYKRYWFAVKPVLANSGNWQSVYQSSQMKSNIHFSFLEENTQYTLDGETETINHDSIGYPLIFTGYNVSQWTNTTTVQILCSSYVLVLNLYLN